MYASCMAGALHEDAGNFASALVDARQALELQPNFQAAAEDYTRVVEKLEQEGKDDRNAGEGVVFEMDLISIPAEVPV